MSGSFSGGSESSLDGDDLLEIRQRFMELTKEKEMLSNSKTQSFELIKKWELQAKTLSKSHEIDKKRIAALERELSNCNQEIDYLQDQLNMRNLDLNCVDANVRCLQSKLADMENLAKEVESLREQVKISESQRLSLMQEIEDKEVVIRHTTSIVKELEESMSSAALEYQCEIEGTKLESVALEQNLLETKKLLEERTLENSRMNELIEDLKFQIQDANKVIVRLDEENKDLKEKFRRSDMDTETFVGKVEEQFHEWLVHNDNEPLSGLKKHASTFSKALSSHLSEPVILDASEADLRNKMDEMSHQIDTYEVLVEQLKAELREERIKAKEEAEELAQEMAELRYRLTDMLEEECKRRANIEQISLQRIGELEAQIATEQQKSTNREDLVLWNKRSIAYGVEEAP